MKLIWAAAGCFLMASLAQAKTLLVIPGVTQQQMEKLVRSGEADVRGHFGEYLFLMREEGSSGGAALPSFASIMSFQTPQDADHYIIEGDATAEEWGVMMKGLADHGSAQMHLEDREKGLVVFSLPSSERVPPLLRLLPWDAEIVSLPQEGIRPPSPSASGLLAGLVQRTSPPSARKSEGVEGLIKAVNQEDLRSFATYLSGENPSSPFITRHSSSSGGVSAGEWARDTFERYGFNSTLDPFSSLHCPNVIAELRGERSPDEVVIVGAHLDCRNKDLSDSRTRAPGANDDGSGSAAVLQIARAISETGARFGRTLRLALWCGEEQGLLGSRAYARRVLGEGQTIVGMFQADMIGYQAYEEPQCAFVNRYTDADLTAFSRNMARLYVPDLKAVETSACCSDHQSFYENGYPSVGLVEGGGYVIDPRYHHVEDLVNRPGYSLPQMEGITRVLLASAAELAEMVSQ